MSASDSLSPAQFVNTDPYYHGAARPVQDGVVKPGQRRSNNPPNPGGEETYYSGRYAYASASHNEAFGHAASSDEKGRVYRVSPVGIPRRDPEDENGLHPTAFMSTQGWKVEPHDAETRRYNDILREP